MMELIRKCIFRPYRKGQGPTFTLQMFDAGWIGRHRVAYRLHASEHGKSTLIFDGDDFGCSPLHAIDSDETVASLMSFLTLRPGDTDSEYFDNYTDIQLEYCEQHAEYLGIEVWNRFEVTP